VAAQEGAQLCLPTLHRAPVGKTRLDRCAFGHGRPPLGGGRLAHDGAQHGAEHGDRRIPLDQIAVVEPAEPPVDGLEAPVCIGGERAGGDQASDLVGVASGLGVGDGHLRQAVLLAPRGGAGVELRDRTGLALAQLDAQELLEQPVVPVPLAPAIERHDEQVRTLQRLQEAARVRSPDDGVAEGTAHALEYRGSGQEGHPPTGDPGQQLRPQVVGHQAVVAAECERTLAAPVPRLEGKRGKVQADRPPLGVPDELGHLRIGQADASCVEEQECLRIVHRQVVRADLHDRAAGA
jgi:hypothetical protein